MALDRAQHEIEELEGVRCSVVEKGVSPDRAGFLKKLLELNGFEVKMKAEEESGLLTIGVTDIVFNVLLAVYGHYLKSPSGKKVTPAYWLQQSDAETEAEMNYWSFKK